MTPKAIVTKLLLAFVAVSVVYMIAKESGVKIVRDDQGSSSASVAGGAAGEDNGEGDISNRVSVTYFHGTARCAACVRAERMVEDILKKNFGEAMERGELVFGEVDVQNPTNRHLAHRYNLSSISIVVSEKLEGEELRWKNLDGFIPALRNPPTLEGYIVSEVKEYLNYD